MCVYIMSSSENHWWENLLFIVSVHILCARAHMDVLNMFKTCAHLEVIKCACARTTRQNNKISLWAVFTLEDRVCVHISCTRQSRLTHWSIQFVIDGAGWPLEDGPLLCSECSSGVWTFAAWGSQLALREHVLAQCDKQHGWPLIMMCQLREHVPEHSTAGLSLWYCSHCASTSSRSASTSSRSASTFLCARALMSSRCEPSFRLW